MFEPHVIGICTLTCISFKIISMNIMMSWKGKSGDQLNSETDNISLYCLISESLHVGMKQQPVHYCACISECHLSVYLLLLEWHSIIFLPWETFAASLPNPLDHISGFIAESLWYGTSFFSSQVQTWWCSDFQSLRDVLDAPASHYQNRKSPCNVFISREVC